MKTIRQKTDRKMRAQTAGGHKDLPSAEWSRKDAVPSAHDSAPRAERPKCVSIVTKKARARGKKPVRIGDALRQRGFDEHTIADHYVDVAHRLKGKSDKSGNVEKLLVDVLKECSKYLDPARPQERADERAGAGGAAVHVHLVHSVTRPARGVSSGAANEGDSAAELEAAASAGVEANDVPVNSGAESISASDFSS